MFKSLDEIGYMMTSTSRHVIRFLDNFLKDDNITPEQWSVLKQLSTHEKMTQKELSLLTDKDQATLTRILDLLEKKGLVERRINQEDRRSFYIHVNTEGRTLVEELYPKIEKLYKEQIFKDISDEQLEHVIHILSVIRNNSMK